MANRVLHLEADCDKITEAHKNTKTQKHTGGRDDKMRLTDLFHLDNGRAEQTPETPKTFGEALLFSFSVLCRGDKAVEETIRQCLADTENYCEVHKETYDARGLHYNKDAERWLQLIAATEAAMQARYLRELDGKGDAAAFRSALGEVLERSGIVFSLKNLSFDPVNQIDGKKDIPDWIARFNEYAGQSGITVYAVDIDSNSYVIGAAPIADYAQAAETAGEVGIRITSRPD